MSRFKRLTDAEARTLTRRELLDRIEAEQQYWFRKKTRTAEEDAAFREFTRGRGRRSARRRCCLRCSAAKRILPGRLPVRRWPRP